jgi:hypothetical protein
VGVEFASSIKYCRTWRPKLLWRRALVVGLALPIVVFALWGAWEMARQAPSAPQAMLGAVAFVAIGGMALAASALGAQAIGR